MKSFIGASVIRKEMEIKANEKIMDSFIDKFNKKLKEGEFTLHSGLDKVLKLNEKEFNLVKDKAFWNGYSLTEVKNKDNTVTYTLRFI